MQKREQYTEKFLEIYQALNEKQKLAVDTLEGPVMVIAGPGTGKTQILSARIGKILLETDTLPENILCLTYTDAGALAMRRRLLQFIGPDAYKVNISTFHAFCNEVIQDNLSLFEKTKMDPVSELEKIEMFKNIIDHLPKNNPLKRYRGDVYFEIKNMDHLFSAMKKEGWSPAVVHSCIDQYIADLPNRDEYVYKRKYKQFNAGDLKQEKYDAEVERMEKLRAAVDQYEPYQQLMRKRNRYDFDDMIRWVLQAFEENKLLLSQYQERYLYVLVDEYQDTSGTQNRLVELLISYWDQPNIFVVGDDDQSIYRFQGANIENMLQFARAWQRDLYTVVLTSNYRSVQPILDASKSLIDRNQERLINKMEGLSKEMLASNPNYVGVHHPPSLHVYHTQRDEMIDIARSIQKLLQQGVAPGRIAVIYKENKYGEELATFFRHIQVPYYSKRSLNVFEIPLARRIILMLRYLAAEHDVPYGGDEMLFELLHHEWFSIAPIEIAKLSVAAAEKRYTDLSFSFRRLLAERAAAPAADLFTNTITDELRKAASVVEALIAAVPNLTLQQLFENTIRSTGILGYIMRQPDKHWHLQVLTAVFDFVKEETRRNPSLTLAQFIGIIDLMEKEDIPLPLLQVNGSEKGVNLLTAHGAKGLEFEYVFLAGCNAAFWEKKRKPGSGYRLPDTLLPSTAPGGVTESHEELRRLFFVAMTRAEQHLTLSYCRFKNDGKEMEPSMFVAEVQEAISMPVETKTLATEDLEAFTALQFETPLAPELAVLEEDFIAPIIEKFVMNVTALNNYFKCPLQFYFNNLIRIPSPKSENTEFGLAVHHALEQLFRNMKKHPAEQFPSCEALIADFEWYMHRHRESFTAEQFHRRMEYGREVLSNYYNHALPGANKIVAIEKGIKNVLVKGVPIKGKMDKLEFDGKQVNVVDYKTGDPDKAIEKLQPPSEKQPLGGDYWRQAVFYKILIDQDPKNDWQAISTQFDFVEPDKKKRYRSEKLVITPADITTVSEQISSVWERIQQRDFYTGCGKPECHWCNFVKENNMAVALHEMETEAQEQEE